MDALKSGIQSIGEAITNTTQQAKDYMMSTSDDQQKNINANEKVNTLQQQAEDNKKFDQAQPVTLSTQQKVDHNNEINDPNYEGINSTTKYYQEHGHRQIIDDVPNKETPTVSENSKEEKMKKQGQSEAHDSLQR